MSAPEVLATVQLIRRLYVDLEQPAGGPLHVQLDDGNLGDYWVGEEANRGRYGYLFDGSFERWSQAGDNVSHERKCAIRDTCEAILVLLRQMDETGRHAAVSLFWKSWDGLRWVPNDEPEPSGPAIVRGGIQWPVEPEMKAAFDAAGEDCWIAPTEEFRTDNGPKAAPEEAS